MSSLRWIGLTSSECETLKNLVNTEITYLININARTEDLDKVKRLREAITTTETVEVQKLKDENHELRNELAKYKLAEQLKERNRE